MKYARFKEIFVKKIVFSRFFVSNSRSCRLCLARQTPQFFTKEQFPHVEIECHQRKKNYANGIQNKENREREKT
ncbi:MAG: hypothetical protein CSA05_02185 [Bacteroidia bacterium]|nr:MAG: hypothetical protein CSA05_02185 [Bacteroidia bacterium]